MSDERVMFLHVTGRDERDHEVETEPMVLAAAGIALIERKADLSGTRITMTSGRVFVCDESMRTLEARLGVEG